MSCGRRWGKAKVWGGELSTGNLESKQETGSEAREWPIGEGKKKSVKGVIGLGERIEEGSEGGSGREAGGRFPGGTAEKAWDRVNDDSVTGAVEAKGDTEEVASSRASGNSSRLTSAVALLHTSQKGSGHKS